MVIERSAGELSPDDPTAFPSDQPFELCVERETVAFRELPQRITGPDRDLDGSRFSHTHEYTQSDARVGPLRELVNENQTRRYFAAFWPQTSRTFSYTPWSYENSTMLPSGSRSMQM